MSFYSKRKPALLHFSILLLFLASWLLSYLWPAIKALSQDEHLFYGTVTHASIPSVFGGTNIPFMDKTMFQLNGDTHVTFVLYASPEIMEEMSEWFSFGAVNAGEIPLEVSAARVAEDRFVVHAISSTDGEVDFDELVMDYQVYYGFIGGCILAAMALSSTALFILWLVKRRR